MLYSKPFKVISLVAPDGSAKANFIPFGATATNFWVKDKVSKSNMVLTLNLSPF